jgi:tetraprenyl-beta-curcumene synthase
VVARYRRPLVEANAFAAAATVYWLEVFPYVKRQLRSWRGRAAGIPDRRLSQLALETQDCERGNLEGSAVFALLAPRAHRGAVIRAAVAFQALYDFLDTLAELPVADPTANGHSLHAALLAALDPERPAEDYFEHSGFPAGDGGYVEELIAVCRRALAKLPRYGVVAGLTQQAAARMVAYQALNHDPGAGASGCEELRRWALALTPQGSGLQWWETAAGAASSLGVFALIAAAAQPSLGEADARAAADAYFPWVGALHVLLDSLVDHELDLRSGDHSLVAHYPAPAFAARRLGAIASEATLRLERLEQCGCHGLILAAMASFYLSLPAARAPAASPVSSRVVSVLGPQARAAIALLRVRGALRTGT